MVSRSSPPQYRGCSNDQLLFAELLVLLFLPIFIGLFQCVLAALMHSGCTGTGTGYASLQPGCQDVWLFLPLGIQALLYGLLLLIVRLMQLSRAQRWKLYGWYTLLGFVLPFAIYRLPIYRLTP